MPEYRVRWEKHGDDLCLPIPKEVVERLGLVAGDIGLLRDPSGEIPAELLDDEAVKRMQRLLDENPNAIIAIAK